MKEDVTQTQLLKRYDSGAITRSELVSALATQLVVMRIADPVLRRDVEALRARILNGEFFVIGSTC